MCGYFTHCKIMKHTLLFTLLLILISCGGSETRTLTIKGLTLEDNTSSNSVYLDGIRNMERLDTVDLINGHFSFSTTIDSPDLYYISHKNQITYIIAEPGEVTIKEQKDKTYTVGGTILNDRLQIFLDAKAQIMAELASKKVELREKHGDDITSYNTEFREYHKDIFMTKVSKLEKETIAENFDNMLGAYLYIILLIEYDTLENINSFVEKNPTAVGFKPIMRVKKIKENHRNTQLGHKFVDIKGHDYGINKDVNLSDYLSENNYTIICFWASIGSNTLRVLSELEILSNKYKSEGLNVVGVNAMDHINNINQFTSTNNITFPQISCDIDSIYQYGVTELVGVVVVDKNGNIMDRSLIGRSLAEFIGFL